MSYILGLMLLVAAIVIAIFGDRAIQGRGGTFLRMFSWPKGRASFVKWPVAGALALTGLWVLLAL